MSIFAAAKVAKSSSKAPKEYLTVHGERFNFILSRWAKLKKETAKFEAETSELAAEIKTVVTDKYLKEYKSIGRHPGSIRFRSDDGETLQFIPTDRYPVLDEDQAKFINNLAGRTVATEKVVYSFNSEILERYIDQIGAAIEALPIPDEDKANLLTAKSGFHIEKGAIERLAEWGDPEKLYPVINPVTILKNS
jgi:hypothetical protein